MSHADSASGDVFSRASILAWANTILGKTYASFHDIPPTETALLLYGIITSLRAERRRNGEDQKEEDAEEDAAPLFLQEIQFSAGAGGGGSSSSAANSVVQQRNAAHVLAMVHRIGLQEEARRGSGSDRLPAVKDLSARAEEWVRGELFADTLRVWHWIRAVSFFTPAAAAAASASAGEAAPREVSVESIQGAIRAFLTGESLSSPTSSSPLPPPAPRTNLLPSPGQKRPRDDSTSEGSTRTDEKGTAHSYATSQRHETLLQDAAARSVDAHKENSEYTQHLAEAKENLQRLIEEREQEEALLRAQEAADAGKDGAEEEDTKKKDVIAAYMHPKEASGEGSVTPLSCTRCPATFTYALQSNLLLIEKLEAARQRAIRACMKKDEKALLAALADFA